MTKFAKIFTVEYSYQLRRPATWLCLIVLFALAFLIVVGNYLPDAREGYFLLNAPLVIAAVTAICSVKWLLIGASITGDAATRDIDTRMHYLTYTLPVSKRAYLAGRFLASLALHLLILLAIPLGLIVAIYGTGVEAELLGPFRISAYLTSFCFILLPNALFATAMQFSLAIAGRSSSGSYLAGAGIFIVSYTVWPLMPELGEWGHWVDPMYFGPVLNHLSGDWSPLEKNSRLMLPDGPFLVNRLAWFCISLVVLMLTYWRFQTALPQSRRKKRTSTVRSTSLQTSRLPWITDQILPISNRTFGVVTQMRQLRLVAWRSFLQISGSRAGIPLLVALACVLGATIQGNLKGKGEPLLPRTDFLLELLTAPMSEPGPFGIAWALLTVFHAGELIWRERDAGVHELVGTSPVPEWVLFSGRFLALALMLVVWLIFTAMAGVVFQLSSGAARIEWVLYAQLLFGLQLTEGLLFAVLALVVHVLVHQKYIGHWCATVSSHLLQPGGSGTRC